MALHNFVAPVEPKAVQKKDYVLYFGRYSREKGIETLVQAAKELPEIPFVFAGSGPLEHLLDGIPNVKNVGFQTGEALEMLIRKAQFTVHPSACYENCPFSIMESQMYATPVLATNIGGIPELIRVGETGELFESGNAAQLRQKIEQLWYGLKRADCDSHNCRGIYFDSLSEYAEKLIKHIKD